jgi:hypothetical protein
LGMLVTEADTEDRWPSMAFRAAVIRPLKESGTAVDRETDRKRIRVRFIRVVFPFAQVNLKGVTMVNRKR